MKLKNREKVWIYNIVIALVSFAQKNYVPFGFSFSKNMAKFEAFLWIISSRIRFLFLKSALAMLQLVRDNISKDGF